MFHQRRLDLINISVKVNSSAEKTEIYDSLNKSWSESHSTHIISESSDHKVEYNFPHYFRWYFRFTHFIFLAPFRAKQNKEGDVDVLSFTPSYLITGIILFGCWILSILQIRLAASKPLKEDPEKLFSIANYSCWSFYIVAFSKLVFSKKSYQILSFPAVPATLKVRIVSVILGSAGILLGLSFTILSWFTTDKGAQLDYYSSGVMYMIYVSHNISETYQYEKLNRGGQVLVIVVVCLTLFQFLIFAFLEIFNFLIALSVYEITSKWQAFHLSEPNLSAKVLMKHFRILCEQFKLINEINSVVLLSVYVQTLSWTSSSILDVMEEIDWFMKFYMVFYYVLYFLTYYLAAEANHKATLFEDKIWDTYKKELLESKTQDSNISEMLISLARRTRGNSVGLEGGKFFCVSYPFIGSTLSVLLTLGIIILQFRASK